jgi:hypothetical protein
VAIEETEGRGAAETLGVAELEAARLGAGKEGEEDEDGDHYVLKIRWKWKAL